MRESQVWKMKKDWEAEGERPTDSVVAWEEQTQQRWSENKAESKHIPEVTSAGLCAS